MYTKYLGYEGPKIDYRENTNFVDYTKFVIFNFSDFCTFTSIPQYD